MIQRVDLGGAIGFALAAITSVGIAAALVSSKQTGVILLAVAGLALALGTVALSSGAVIARSVDAVSGRSIGRSIAFVGIFFSCAPAVELSPRLSLSELVCLTAIFFTVTEYLASGLRVRPNRSFVLFLVGAGMLAAGGLLASAGYHGPGGSAKAAFHSAYQLALPTVLLTLVCRTRRDASNALKVWVVSIAVSSVVGIIQILAPGNFPASALDHGRAVGLTLHPNDLGSIAGIATAAVWILVTNSRGLVRVGWLAAAAALLGGILVSGSAGGMIAAIISLLTWLVLDRARGKATFVIASAVLAFAVVALLAPFATSSAQRLSGIVTGTTPVKANTGLIRIEDYKFGLASVTENPFVGVGANSRAAITPQGTRVQNVLLQPWMEMGLLGFFGVVLSLSAAAASVMSTLRSSRRSTFEQIAIALATMFVAFLFVANEQLVYTKMIWWFPVGLCFGAGAAIVQASFAGPEHST